MLHPYRLQYIVGYIPFERFLTCFLHSQRNKVHIITIVVILCPRFEKQRVFCKYAYSFLDAHKAVEKDFFPFVGTYPCQVPRQLFYGKVILFFRKIRNIVIERTVPVYPALFLHFGQRHPCQGLGNTGDTVQGLAGVHPYFVLYIRIAIPLFPDRKTALGHTYGHTRSIVFL